MILKRKRLRDHFETLADYQNKLIRVARNKVYWVMGGNAMYVDKLPFTDYEGRKRDWPEVIEVATMPGDVKNQLVSAVNKIPSNIQEQLISKGEELVQQGLGNVNATDPSLLPYNAQTKRAIQVANGMDTNGISQASMLSQETILYIVLGLAVVMGVLLYMRK